jgi:phage shock protein PspC (stress-responsive transcriptional regulator)
VDRPVEIRPLVAGVCNRLAGFFRCNAWVLRTGFVLLLLVKTLWTLAVYGGMALLFRLADHYRRPVRSTKKDFTLESPQFAGRNHKIRELERRFSEWEGRGRQ